MFLASCFSNVQLTKVVPRTLNSTFINAILKGTFFHNSKSSSIITFKYCHGRTVKNELFVHEGLFMLNENLLMFTYVPWYLLRGLIGS